MTHQQVRRTILFIMFFAIPIIMNIFSPVIIILSGLDGVYSFAFYAWTIVFISSFFMGRSFCAYVCPYGGMQMAVHCINKRQLVKSRFMKPLRLIIGVLWLGLIIYIYLSKGGSVTDLKYNMESGISVDDFNGVMRYYMIIGGALLFVLIMGKRSFCKYLCPMSLLTTIGNFVKNKLSIPSLRLEVSQGCVGCMKCDQVCPMSLEVHDMAKKGMVEDNDCILCGECVAVCPKKVLARRFTS